MLFYLIMIVLLIPTLGCYYDGNDHYYSNTWCSLTLALIFLHTTIFFLVFYLKTSALES